MRLLAAVLSGLVLASVLPARTPWLGEYRALQESLRYLPPNMRFYELDQRGLLPRSPAATLSDSVGLRLVGKWGAGPSVKVTGRDSLVFLSRGSQVAVINYEDTANPQVLSYIEVNGLVSRSVLVGNRLYIGSTGSEPKYIDVFDVAEPAAPQRLGSLQTRLLDIDVVDTLVYTVAKDSFRVFNFSDPANPRQVGACRDTGYTLSACNGYAYIADRWGLYVVDVRDPTSPHHEASWGTNVISVKARGNICCATTDNQSNPGVLKFTILDVRTPSSPIPLGSLDSCGAYDVFLDGQLAFLSGYYIFNEFRIVDISDSTHPHHVGTAATQDQNFGVWENPANELAYVADDFGGLIVIDIANINAPAARDTMLKAGLSYDVSVQGSLCYVASDAVGLVVLDISDLAQIRQIGALDSTRDMVARSIAVQDSFAYMSWGPARPWLRSISVSDPTMPTKAGGVGTFDFPKSMVIRDSLLYVAQAYRFQVVNVARPRQPTVVGSCVLQEDSYGLLLVDTLAFVGSYPFTIIRVSDPTSPVVVGTIPRGAFNGSVRDTFLFLSSGGVLVYSIADPTQPRMLDSVSLGANTYWVEVVDSLLYTGNQDGVRVLDARDIHDLRVLACARTPDPADRLTHSTPYVYAACFRGGVSIFDTAATGVSEARPAIQPADDLLIAPSPVRNHAIVRIRNAARKEVMSSAYTVAGVRVPVAASVSVGDRWTTLRFDLRSVASGVYLLRVRVGKTARSLRVVKL